MGLDTSMYNALGANVTPLANPLDVQTKQQHLAALTGQNALADYTIAKAKRDDADQETVRNVLASSGGDYKAGASALLSRGLVDPALKLTKAAQDQEAKQAEIERHRAETGKIGTESAMKQFDAIGQTMGALTAIPGGARPEHVANAIQHMVDIGILNGDKAHAVLAQMPKDPAQMTPWLESLQKAALSAKDQIALTTPDANARLQSDTSIKTTGMNNATSVKTTGMTNATSRANNRDSLAQSDNHFRQTQAAPAFNAEAGGFITKPNAANPNGAITPLAGFQSKPSTEYLKQATAFQNMNDALGNYSAKLKNFNFLDTADPSKRAEMGTAYQNALLQAKEIYQLGVLNGGDERILKGIINNPLDVTSLMTPKKAMLEQAEALQGIIKRNNANLAKVHKQPEIPMNPAPSATAAAAHPPEIDALLQKYGGK